jgi:hypothetical protein
MRTKHALLALLVAIIVMDNLIGYSAVFGFAAVSSAWFYVLIIGNKAKNTDGESQTMLSEVQTFE